MNQLLLKITKKTHFIPHKTIGISIKTYNKKSIKELHLQITHVIKMLQRLIHQIIYFKKKQIVFAVHMNVKNTQSSMNWKKRNKNVISNKYLATHSFFSMNSPYEKKIIKRQMKYDGIQKGWSIHLQLRQMIRLTLMLHQFKQKLITTQTPPVKKTKYTVLKSPHVDKKAREQFQKQTNTLRIQVKKGIVLLKYVEQLLNIIKKETLHNYMYKYMILQ